ncbi:uncharacterized protein LOC111710530 isoform X2 [Eurytemora carolleeae]|uniref:uncharacterized protein LOC111710530 isoform X2 n=1 Tax=Eurytemora carolleeae TaxID=1294199 RepID=UPI000C773B95|nr:uncharacterized protein LOC111710530 isoform X2 [Eurytemora carolleeae]|eukprot:XP_023340401.1 uncharacterized protein LOC111710530 isoform X2 [Eurytemora affinis]
MFSFFQMENYDKVRTEEENLNTGNIPILSLPAEHGWLLVGGHAKITKLLEPALNLLLGEGAIVIAGSGSNTSKVLWHSDLCISCYCNGD